MTAPPAPLLLVDAPLPGVRRLTLNRPDKHNALNNALRGAILDALHAADGDAAVRVTVIRGAGKSFCSGYDLAAEHGVDRPYPGGGGWAAGWARHVVQGWLGIWDLDKPVIAQVHGHCLAGGSELAAACDLVYVAQDARIGYPVTRTMGPPDMQIHPWLVGMRRAMELYLTGDAMTGAEAADSGFATRAFPAPVLEAETLRLAERVAGVPSDLQAINKRTVHSAMEAMGLRSGLKAGANLLGLAHQTESSRIYREQFRLAGASVGAIAQGRKAS